MAKLLLDIANSVMKCIQMEADWPSKNPDRSMPILDMKVWTDEEGSYNVQALREASDQKNSFAL